MLAEKTGMEKAKKMKIIVKKQCTEIKACDTLAL
jgi:hypothetical protein